MTYASFITVCVFLCWAALGSTGLAQSKKGTPNDSASNTNSAFRIVDPQEAVNKFIESEGMDSSIVNINSSTADPRLDSVKLTAWKSYYAYMNTGYKHRARVFLWQLISSCIIFCVVILLVLCGVYFAWLQFKLALKQIQARQKNATNILATEMSASPKEIKVSSPVLGVIILLISLLFFYLYLVHVYPINETF